MSRWPGRLITKTPVVPSGAAPTSSAPGIWTLAEVAYWNRQGRWPSAGADPYWSYVSYLLGTTATNAAQNNTFLDSSTNNFTITRNGNTTQGSFTPYGMLWSNFFDGTSDSLSYTGGSSIAFGTSNFTIELWAYLTNTGTYSPFLRPDDSGVFPEFGYDFGTGQLKFDARNSAIVAVTTTMPTAQWVHLAACRSGTNLRLFVNGSQVGTTTTNSTNFGTTTGIIRIGGSNFSASHTVNGYLSSFRVVNGTAVYTSNFTPPAVPLTAISGTSLLTCQSNRFLDNSTNNFAITANGNTAVSSFSPFILAPPGYEASVVAGSGYFDGSGDYLSLADNAALQMGSGDFTVDFWWYPASISGYQTPYEKGYIGAGGLLLQTGNGDGKIIVYASGSAVITATTAVTVGAWNHMALVRSGTSMVLYLNGTSVGSATNSTNFNSTGSAGVGANVSGGGAGAYPINGYMAGLRLVKGTAVYTSAFTPPTTPPTPISGTSFLCNFTNAGIFDASMNNDMETVGNAQVSTGQAKYGSTSAYFDGSSYLKVANNPAFNLPGDFTIEFWWNPSSLSGLQSLVGKWGLNQFAWLVQATSSNIILQTASGGTPFTTITNAWSPSTGQWYHIAFTRSGTNVRAFVNGSQVGTTQTSNKTCSSVALLGVGANPDGPQEYSTGYIDDLRITKGYARYTANFTPPTAALPVY